MTNRTVTPNAPSAYTIVYSPSVPSVNARTNTRTVYIVDTTLPVVAVLGANPLTNECHTAFAEPRESVVDANTGPRAVVTNSTGNTNATDAYTIGYSASDRSGSAGTNNRIV